MPLGRATAVANAVVTRLQAHPELTRVFVAGGTRRGVDVVDAVEILAVAGDPGIGLKAAVQTLRARTTTSIHQADTIHTQHLLVEGERVLLHACPPDTGGASLLHLTGSAAHLEGLRRAAAARGGELTASGLILQGNVRFADDEETIYRELGLPWIAPELREGGDEIARAAGGGEPRLITREDIRGDLHMHSRWSDGQNTIDDMVRASIALGYEYVAITDHSQSSAPATNLKPHDIPRQSDEIARLRETHPGIAILHGCEVDILPNGALDFNDRDLERFDIVLASLHDEAGHSPERLLSRYRTALRHPLVSMITHPANRMVPHRTGYRLDYRTLFAEAAATGTIVEIDGSPTHLDLSGEMAREAVQAGAMLAIDSDSHRVDVLGPQMALGILLARRGWVEPPHVVNTRRLEQLRAFVAAKRQ